MDANDINKFFNQLEKKLQNRKYVPKPISVVNNFPLTLGQCFYILDLKQNKISYQKGVKEMLGYTANEFDLNKLIDIIHPDDANLLNRLIKATLLFASENNVSKDVAFFLTYRIKKKNGNYIKILRQSNIFDHDEKGKIISNISMLSDVSFLNLPNKVDWSFQAPGLDQKKFRSYVVKEYTNFFTDRELEIVKLLRNGFTSKEIASKLNISKHTVDTHRRKILQKSNCESTIDLINFSIHNGLI